MPWFQVQEDEQLEDCNNSKIERSKILKGYDFAITSLSTETEQLEMFIKDLGGIVVEQLDEKTDNLFLLAPSFQSTQKYFEALALEIPCINFVYILHCHIFKKIFNPIHYALFAGRNWKDQIVPIPIHFFTPTIVDNEKCKFHGVFSNSTMKKGYYKIELVKRSVRSYSYSPNSKKQLKIEQESENEKKKRNRSRRICHNYYRKGWRKNCKGQTLIIHK